MGDAETIHEMITKARGELKKAQDTADFTPRPANACTAHDSQFALTRANSGALDTLLIMAQQDVGQVDQTPTGGIVASVFRLLDRPWPWAFGSIAVFSPNLCDIITTVQGVLHK